MENQRLRKKDDMRWTKAMKCYIMNTNTDLIEMQNKDRDKELGDILTEKKQNLNDLGLNVKKNRFILKEVMVDFNSKILANTNPILLKRYGKTHPDEIKSSIKRCIHQINVENNTLLTKIEAEQLELRLLKNNSTRFPFKENTDHSKLKRIMEDEANLDEKIKLARLKKKKMKDMVVLLQKNLNKYDPILDQLSRDKEELAANLMNEIELGVKFESDTNKKTQELKDELFASQKQTIKQTGEIEQINCVVDSIDRNR